MCTFVYVFVLNRWVAFENPGFAGEVYVLEKGLYGSPEDWGARNLRISSVQPVFQVNYIYLTGFSSMMQSYKPP